MAFLDAIMCPKCKKYLKTDGKVIVLGYGNDHRRVNRQHCPDCGLEVWANMGSRHINPNEHVDVEVKEL